MARRGHAGHPVGEQRRGTPAGISPGRTSPSPSRPRPMARRRDNPRRRDGPPRRDPHRSDRRPRASSGRRSDSRYTADGSADWCAPPGSRSCPAARSRGPMKRLKIFSVTRWPVTSSWNLPRNQSRSRRTSTRGGGLLRQQPAAVEPAAARLVEIFRDDPGAGRDDLAVDEGRRRPGRVEPKILDPALPGPLLLQLRLQPDLGEHDPHEARVRAEGVMMEDCHSKARGLARERA